MRPTPRASNSTFRLSYILPASSHAKDTIASGFRRNAIGQCKTKPDHVARLRRLDDAVIPEPRCGIVGVALALILAADLALERAQLCLRYLMALQPAHPHVDKNRLRGLGRHGSDLR